jgi:hypothetical protein
MRSGVEDDNGTQVSLADGKLWVDAERGTQTFERPLVRPVRSLGADSEGTAGKELDESKYCALDTQETEDRREA